MAETEFWGLKDPGDAGYYAVLRQTDGIALERWNDDKWVPDTIDYEYVFGFSNGGYRISDAEAQQLIKSGKLATIPDPEFFTQNT